MEAFNICKTKGSDRVLAYGGMFGYGDVPKAEIQVSLDQLCASFSPADMKRLSAAVAEEAAEAKALARLERRAQEDGWGSLTEMWEALADLEADIEAGAQYSFTGQEVGVESADCTPTIWSYWSDGEASGWWNCRIDFLGRDSEIYSIEVKDGDWASSSDEPSAELKWFAKAAWTCDALNEDYWLTCP
jgi:hypothetical protein